MQTVFEPAGQNVPTNKTTYSHTSEAVKTLVRLHVDTYDSNSISDSKAAVTPSGAQKQKFNAVHQTCPVHH